MKEIGCFISPHGFGHATRVCGILEALYRKAPILPHLFTTVDTSVFSQSLQGYHYHQQVVDIGFSQDNAFDIDLTSTLNNLSSFLPHRQETVEQLAQQCRNMSFLLCDISSLGIMVAEKAGIPSVLIENFTWDWLYSSHHFKHPELRAFSDYLREIYAKVTYRIQTEPYCQEKPAVLRCGPIFRNLRGNANEIRKQIDREGRKIVLVTLGGLGFAPAFLDSLAQYPEFLFVFYGQKSSSHSSANIIMLGRDNDMFHPDLIDAVDIVVFKAGYSTLAECYQCGKPSLCIQRQGFAESQVIEGYAQKNLKSVLVSQPAFINGEWLPSLRQLINLPPLGRGENGAEKVAEFLATLL